MPCGTAFAAALWNGPYGTLLSTAPGCGQLHNGWDWREFNARGDSSVLGGP